LSPGAARRLRSIPQEKTMNGLYELRRAARIAKKKVENAEKKYSKDWEILLDAKDKEQKEPASRDAQAAHKTAIYELNKDRHINNGLIDDWLRLRAEAREAENLT
jgi:hypothetical protein